jgi:hypothetical protein
LLQKKAKKAKNAKNVKMPVVFFASQERESVKRGESKSKSGKKIFVFIDWSWAWLSRLCLSLFFRENLFLSTSTTTKGQKMLKKIAEGL